MSSIKDYIDLLLAFTEKEMKVRYKNTILGILWILLNPVLQMAIIGFIFSFFIKIPNYFLFLFTGLLPWQFFTLSLNKATNSFVNERSLLQKARFSKEIIPISVILSNFIQLLISFCLFLIFLFVTGNFLVSGLLLLLPALVWLLAFTIGLSLITASLNVRFRDVGFFIQTVIVLWFYATPVLYNLEVIQGKLHPFFALNPLTSPFVLVHRAFLGYGQVSNQIMLINLIISILVFLLGILIYRKNHRYFIDWL